MNKSSCGLNEAWHRYWRMAATSHPDLLILCLGQIESHCCSLSPRQHSNKMTKAAMKQAGSFHILKDGWPFPKLERSSEPQLPGCSALTRSGRCGDPVQPFRTEASSANTGQAQSCVTQVCRSSAVYRIPFFWLVPNFELKR